MAGRPEGHRGSDKIVGQDGRGPEKRFEELGGALEEVDEGQADPERVYVCEQSLRGTCSGDGGAIQRVVEGEVAVPAGRRRRNSKYKRDFIAPRVGDVLDLRLRMRWKRRRGGSAGKGRGIRQNLAEARTSAMEVRF